MQDCGDPNRQSFTRPGELFPDGLCFGNTKKDDEAIGPEVLNIGVVEKDSAVTSEASKEEKEDFAINLEIEKKEEDGVVTKDGCCNGLQDYAKSVEKNEKQKIGGEMQTTASKGDTEKMKDDGSGEWHVVVGSAGDSNHRNDDSVSRESKDESDDDFDFDFIFKSKDDIEEEEKIAPSIAKTFNLDLLRDSIKMSDETLLHIEGKDVVLVIGKTGTGKSTFIQGIAGKEFIQSDYSCVNGDVEARKVVFDALDPLPGFEIGHAKSSRTRYLQSYAFNRSIITKTKSQEKRTCDEILYLDTPGFEDTGGEEIDIATSAVLAKVSKKCRSMRFVIIINYVSLLEDRGGAMRSTVKFMRNFVDDFGRHKKSFMFLFTHTDAIKTVPECLDGAKKSLLNEIILTMEGTKNDDDSKDILSFIRTCLEHKYPAVNVLHPLKTDFIDTAKFINDKLKPIMVDSEKGDTSCTLTNSSKMGLMVAIFKLQSNLRLTLRQNPVDAKEVRKIQDTFLYFEKYIQFEEMRAVAVDCKEAIGLHVKHLHEILAIEVKNGTSNSADSLFNESNVSLVKDALLQLEVIDSMNFNVQEERKRITRDVSRFQENLILNKTSKFQGFHENLQKLHAWCGLDLEYKEMVDLVVAHANAVVQQVMDDVSSFQPSQVSLSSTTICKLPEMFCSLRVLKSIQENARGLSRYLTGISEASDTYNYFVSRLKSHFESLDDELSSSSAMQQVDFRDPQGIKNLRSQVQGLEKLFEFVNETNLQDDILPLVRDIRENVESQIVEEFAMTCTKFKDNHWSGDNVCFSYDLKVLQDAVSTFSNFEGSRWKEMEFSYNSLVDQVRSYLKAKSDDLDKMANHALEYGVLHGGQDGAVTNIFARWAWFDEFLPPEDCFVENCLAMVRNKYFKRFKVTAEASEESLLMLASATKNSIPQQGFVNSMMLLKTKLLEVIECEKFSSSVGDKEVQALSLELLEKVREYLQGRASYWKEVLDEWVETVTGRTPNWKRLTTLTKTLDAVVCEIDEVKRMPSEMIGQVMKTDSQSIHDQVIAALSKFEHEVHQSLTNQMNYDELAELLARVRALRNFPRTAPHLPQIEKLKEAACQRVDRDVKEIEDMMVETFEFDKIDNLMETLEKATVLDDFISHDIKSRLRSLKLLQTRKETDVDNAIAEMIEKNNFGGLGEVLKNLAESKSQIRQNKFENSLEMIASALVAVGNDIKAEFPGEMTEEKGLKIASHLEILEQANNEAGEYLKKPILSPRLNIQLRYWKKKIDESFCSLQQKTSTSIENEDFKTVAERNEITMVFLDHLGNYISDGSRKLMRKNEISLQELKKSIPNHIEIFITSSFTESAKLEKILRGLKPVSVIEDPIFNDMSQLYASIVEILVQEVDDFVQKLKVSTEQAQCYDDSIVVMKNLLRSFDLGLKNHLPRAFQDKSETLLETWAEARLKKESEIDFDCVSIDISIKKFAKLLDESSPSSGVWQSLSQILNGSWLSSTYERRKRELNDKVLQKYSRGIQALRIREFSSLNDNLKFLRLTDSFAGRHVPLASNLLKEIQQEVVEHFKLLCKQCQDAVQAENRTREFESLFVEFRGFVLNVDFVVKEANAAESFHLTNRLVYDRLCREILSVETVLNGFEFSDMKQKIEDVRRFGGFIADRYSIFHEELKVCSHVNNDEWLEQLKSKISEHFHNGRDLKRIKYYAILGAPPSASKDEMKRAYRKRILTSHPDKCKDRRYEKEWSDKFLRIQNAYEVLNADFLSDDERSRRPFDNLIRRLGDTLREKTRSALKEQHYDHVENLLFKLYGLDVMECVVSPQLQTDKIRDGVISLVQNHVKKIRTEVDTNWSERKYQELNFNIKDLKTMEAKFKSYPSVFSTSWNTGIIKKVESEIDNLGKNARALIQDKKMAHENRDEFRRCFMGMGAVLVEVPEFKDYTKNVMSEILELCLNSNWGYNFVFNLGLSLKKHRDTEDEKDEAEARIAQNLVNEFRHFKEVLTMIWNEETAVQMPPEEIIEAIRGQCLDTCSRSAAHVHLNTTCLLDQFFEFESAYTSFLGEYLSPEADIKVLVRKISSSCKSHQPISCDKGFGDKLKSALPSILAGIFTVFTIIKSGESYYRYEHDDSGCAEDAKKLLMKPHNIQVLTLLCMFGCGTSGSASLKSQLMQIRTGEGKSMILGAAAVVFGLLGFRVRCVCYSEYLSNRDYELFRDVFDHFGLLSLIRYCKITTLSEEATAAKGNIRGLTLSLLRGTLQEPNCSMAHGKWVGQETDTRSSIPINTHINAQITSCNEISMRNKSLTKLKAASEIMRSMKKKDTKEIMLVDEVDVFFGSEFYGQTYNQVAELKEPEVATILRHIWDTHNQVGKRQHLADIKKLPAYKDLIRKIPGYNYLIENEIALMLDQVRYVDDEPSYHLNRSTDMIGYKVQDTICYKVTYGYRTVFAYLKEADNGSLNDENATLSRVLTMPISCGQFSYANVNPERIVGVSGTLEVMNDYEKRVLQKYGVNHYLYIPSVYGKSNFKFDRVGDGVSIEKEIREFFYRITQAIFEVANEKNRAVIVFFADSKRLNEYTSSAFYRKLGRKKEILTESKSANEKSYVISKAATTGQITLCTSVFGRGTDFFCKDDKLENNGGVHVIQAFLSSDTSEEVQIQGRTARQGKYGTYELILLEKDLEDKFNIKVGSVDKWPRKEYYTRLCEARKKFLEEKYALVETNLAAAKEKDEATHTYFDALLDSNGSSAKKLFKSLYLDMKHAQGGQKCLGLDLALAIDITGSMTAYENAIVSIIESLLVGSNSLLTKLKTGFPSTEFALRVAILGFRDIDDCNNQFVEINLNGTSHFSENVQEILHSVKNLTSSMSGGADIAEDHIGAIQHCLQWNFPGDWEGTMKAILLFTDAPGHGYAPASPASQTIDNYSIGHPLGLTVDSVVEEVIAKDVDLFICSFDPNATAKFEDAVIKKYNGHPLNDGHKVTLVPLVPKRKVQNSASWAMENSAKHNIFVLDESGSMQYDWSGVVSVYNKYMHNRRQRQHDSDLVTVVQFDDQARVTCQSQNIANAPTHLSYRGGDTCFSPAAKSACNLARSTPQSHSSVIIFMSDGIANDSAMAARHFSALNHEIKNRSGDDLELHVIGFGGGTDTRQLQEIANASANGRVHTASDIDSLSKVFVQISGGTNDVASVLEAEISKRISDAVTDRLSAEYFG